VPTSNLKTCFAIEFVGSWHCTAAFFLPVLNSCTDLDPTFLYISILRTCTKFVREYKLLALGVCLLQPCSSAGRRFAVSGSRLNHYRTIISFPQELWTNSMKYFGNWFPANFARSVEQNLSLPSNEHKQRSGKHNRISSADDLICNFHFFHK